MLVYWSISFKIDGDLMFLKDDRLSSGNINPAKIYERLLSIQTYYGKTGGTRLIPNVKICGARIVFVWSTC